MSATFQELTEDQWVDWLGGFLRHEEISPPLPVFEDRHAEELIALFRRLGNASAGARFSQAIARVFEATAAEPVFAECLYISLHVLAVATSDHAKSVLRRRLREEAFEGLEYAGAALQPFLLSILGVYQVDEWLADYIRKSTARFLDSSRAKPLQYHSLRDYLLLGFRLLARRNLFEARLYLDRVIPILEPSGDIELLGEEFITIVIDHGWRYLFSLYLESAEEPTGDGESKAKAIAQALRQSTFPYFVEETSHDLDSFFMILEFLVSLRPESLTAPQLYTILSTIDGMGSEDDKSLATRGLRLAYIMTAGGWEFAMHSVDELEARSMRDDRDTVGLIVDFTQTWVRLHRVKDKGILEILSRSMPRPFDRSPDPLPQVHPDRHRAKIQ